MGNKYYLADAPSQTAFPISKAGYPYIFASAFITAIFALLGFTTFSLIFLTLTLFTCFFFRDPDRTIPTNKSAIVSPADGKIISINTCKNNLYCENECYKISIFMSIFNVHVNRAPFDGVVEKIEYNTGNFAFASLNKASNNNERNAIFIKTNMEAKMCIIQVAGMLARRIICKVKPGDKIKKGQKIGLICFGSRLDIYIPINTTINIKKGDKVLSGSSVIGELVYDS